MRGNAFSQHRDNPMKRRPLLLSSLLLACAPALQAQTATAPFEVVRLSNRVYALVGDLGQRNPQNLGHNMTSGFVVGDNGVLVIDTGASAKGAAAIAAAVAKITPLPVKWAVNTGGQDHRWLGNDWFANAGATTLASAACATDIATRGPSQVAQAKQFLGAAFDGTVPAGPQQKVAQRTALPITGIRVELIPTAGGHTPGDSVVWLPDSRTVFAGDVVFTGRLLGVMPGSGLTWLKTLEWLRDDLKPTTVVPGHGPVGGLDAAVNDSLRYLAFLRDSAQKAFAAGAFDPVEASAGLDQTAFKYLANWDDPPFRARNALHVAEELFKQQ
jgi:glyoxylase-like metal-dependent hydrolase (beta-lactamase superfamily II)